MRVNGRMVWRKVMIPIFLEATEDRRVTGIGTLLPFLDKLAEDISGNLRAGRSVSEILSYLSKDPSCPIRALLVWAWSYEMGVDLSRFRFLPEEDAP